MVDRGWNNTKGEKDICTRGRSQEGDNPTTSRYSNRRTQRKMEDSRVGHQELLVARSNERGGEICGWI